MQFWSSQGSRDLVDKMMKNADEVFIQKKLKDDLHMMQNMADDRHGCTPAYVVSRETER